MNTNKVKHNATDVDLELAWFQEVIDARLATGLSNKAAHIDIGDIKPSKFNSNTSNYAAFIRQHELSLDERLLLMLSIAPHVRPESLDFFNQKNSETQQLFTQFGGIKGKTHTGFLPTGETAMFILAGYDLERRFSLQRLFERDHVFAKEHILSLEEVEKGEPYLSGALTIDKEVLDLLTTGEVRKPRFSAEFPAKLLTTQMDWEDLVLSNVTFKQIHEIEVWLEHRDTLMIDWGMEKKLKPGYKALFYGPPGTGKSLTAALLGKQLERDVYRIDLSSVVSKYIGETEKNLSKIFNRAENKEWILFFDEADALFGKRTDVSDSHDKYANQEVSYLLQRIEEHNGLVILASNLKDNLDDAFIRRFQSIIHFPMPKSAERLRLWEQGFSEATTLEKQLNLNRIAKEHELAGGSIINAVQYSSLMALERGNNIIKEQDLIDGIKKEFQKAGRTL